MLSEIQSKIYVQSSKNQVKVHQTSTRKQRKIRLGEVLEAPGDQDRNKKGYARFYETFLRRPGWPLGAVFSLASPSWAVLRSSWAVLMAIPTFVFWMPLGIRFVFGFGGFGKGKWRQVGTKNQSKIEAAAKAEKPTKH